MDFRFEAHGHPAVLSTHPTTLEITVEKNLTERGNCVVAVGSSAGPKDLPARLRSVLARDASKARLTLEISGSRFSIEGRGAPGLTLSHPTDFVIRKSLFVSDRTLMVHATRSSLEIPRPLVKRLQDPDQKVLIELTVET